MADESPNKPGGLLEPTEAKVTQSPQSRIPRLSIAPRGYRLSSVMLSQASTHTQHRPSRIPAIPKIRLDTPEKAQDGSKSKLSQAIKQFAYHVTIAGLEDFYKTKITAEKIMWTVTYILAISGVAVTTLHVVRQFMDPTIVYNDFLTFNAQAPFPNVTICISAANDREKLREKLVIPEKTKNLIKRTNLSLDDVIENFVLDLWRVDMKHMKYKPGPRAQAGVQIIEETAPGSVFNTLLETVPGCEEVMSECSFEGQQFDCCESSRYLLMDGYICYLMSLETLPSLKRSTFVKGGPTDDSLKEGPAGLTVNVSIDWHLMNFYENLAGDGMLVFVGETGSIYGEPIVIPSNTDAKIKLAPPKQLLEQSGCRSSQGLPKLKYYDYYDPYGRNCVVDLWMSLTFPYLGCDIAYVDHIPKNGSECPAEILLNIASMGFNSDDFQGDVTVNQLEQMKLSKEAAKLVTQLTDLMEQVWMRKSLAFRAIRILDLWVLMRESYHRDYSTFVFQIGTPGKASRTLCQPLCYRWLYPVFSASYGYINLQNQTYWDARKDEPRSWSRVQIYFPEASYQLHVEKDATPYYMLVCDIGGVFGVYLGFSMVTVGQLLAYGGYVLYVWYEVRKRSRVVPIG